MTDLATVDLAATPFTWKTLTAIADTEIVPRALRGNPPAMLATIMLGREMGLGPMQSMNMIDVIDGKPTLSAELLTARIRDAGHSLLCTEFTAETVTAKGVRRDNGDEMSITFTKEMAIRAGLAGKPNWQYYPEAMLWARAVSMLARMLFADVFAAVHVYTPDELGDHRDLPTPSAIAATAADEEIEEALQRSGEVASAVGNVVEILGGEVIDAASVPMADSSQLVPTADAEPALTREELEVRLVELLSNNPVEGSMSEIETLLRSMCRVAERLDIVHGRGNRDFLHAALADVGARHVTELKRSELVNLARSLRSEVGVRFTESLSRPTREENQ